MDFQVHNFREFPGHRSRIIDVRQRVEVEVFSKIVSALCFTKHVVIKVKNLLMQKLNLIITNHATSSIKCKKILTYISTYLQCTVVFKSDHPDEIVDLFANFCFHKGFLTNLSGKKMLLWQHKGRLKSTPLFKVTEKNI